MDKVVNAINEGSFIMECSCCGGKMVKWKYFQYEELQAFLLSKNRQSVNIGNYSEWLRTLKADELVLTSFRREDYNGIKEKYYLRVVERTTKTGIKLKHLTRIFKYEKGQIVWIREISKC
ncbi:MAG: hypothetical protein ACRDBO_09820 [Lachnospiraceae bacterium]